MNVNYSKLVKKGRNIHKHVIVLRVYPIYAKNTVDNIIISVHVMII